MRSIPTCLVCAVVALGIVSGAACTESNASPPASDGGADTGGATGTDVAADVPTGACPAVSDLTLAAPTCNTVVNNATGVPFTQGSGTPPMPGGGTIRDGLYEATRAEGYGGATPAGRRLTLVVQDGATRFFFAGEVLDAAGTQPTLSFRVNATASVVGTNVNLTTTCMSTATSPLPPALAFTATGDSLVMALTTTAATSVTTYTRRGCP